MTEIVAALRTHKIREAEKIADRVIKKERAKREPIHLVSELHKMIK